MAFTDWDFYTSNPSFILGIATPGVDLEYPYDSPGYDPPDIIGDRLRACGDCSVIKPRFNAVPKFPSFLATDRGLLGGRLRVLHYLEDTTGTKSFGLLAMQSVLDIVNTAGNAYGAVFFDGAGGPDIQLVKYSGVVVNHNSGVVLAETPGSGAFAENTLYAIEFEWNSLSTPGEVVMCVRLGTMTDFSDLVTILIYTDTTSPHVTSVAEGFFGAGGTGGYNGTWDEITIQKRVG